MAYLVLVCLALALVIHGYALHISRRGRSGIHSAAFWGGLLGILSIPAAIIASVAYLPFSIAGAGNHPISWILPASWIALGILAGWSIFMSLAAKLRHVT